MCLRELEDNLCHTTISNYDWYVNQNNLREFVIIFNYTLDDRLSKSEKHDAKSDEQEDREMTRNLLQARIDQCCSYRYHPME